PTFHAPQLGEDTIFIPVKSFNQVTEIRIVGSRKKVTKGASVYLLFVEWSRFPGESRSWGRFEDRCDGAGSETDGTKPSVNRAMA
ncbi:MAG: hypothetical protein ACRD7E_13770, partial [Bryobacteraceae bacterium]